MGAPLASQSYSFAHLSDPHLTSLHQARWHRLFSKRVLGYLSWVKKRRAEHRMEVLHSLSSDLEEQAYDHLVVTGDLTHISLPEEFLEARDWLDSLGDAGSVSVVPGNHDAYVPVDARIGLQNWGPYMTSDPDIPVRKDGFPTIRVRGPVAFIGLSSAQPMPPFFATGEVGASQRLRFAELLRWAGAQGLFRVVLIHHPPVVGLEKWRKRLVDAPEVGSVIDECGAELVLHGHCHRPLESQLTYAGKRHVPVIGVPSASSIHHNPERVSQYNLCRVVRGAENWKLEIIVRSYDLAQQQFSEKRRLQLEIPAAA